jgi:hypothetical protein
MVVGSIYYMDRTDLIHSIAGGIMGGGRAFITQKHNGGAKSNQYHS